VHPKPVADFGYNTFPCSTIIAFQDSSQSTATPFTYNWNFGDASTSTLQNPQHQFSATGVYNVTLIATDANTCKDTLILPIVIDTVYNFKVNANQSSCTKGKQFALKAEGGTIYIWKPSEMVSNANIPNPTTSPDTTTNYEVLIGLLTINGDTCSETLHTKIIVSNIDTNNYIISAKPDTFFVGEETQLTFSSNQTYFYEWYPTETLNNKTIANPIAKPISDTWYEVKTSDSLGCSYSKKVFVKVFSNSCAEPNIFVPNGFTPNNDNVNDVLYVNGNYIETISLKIYDRWGEKIFESDNKSFGWDGTFKGSNADAGVYGYIVNATCKDGKTFFKKGNITLVR
jgi:gliding motility-associated-like protein